MTKKNQEQRPTHHHDIQIDCFSVGLGASILLQFSESDGRTVRVLADGGVGKRRDERYVLRKLIARRKPFFLTEQDRVIDLIIGTHYDGDHLRGLVPILNDHSICVREIWLPAVQKRNDRMTVSRITAEDGSLVHDLVKRGDRSLIDYISHQFEQLDEVDELLSKLISAVSEKLCSTQAALRKRMEKLSILSEVARKRSSHLWAIFKAHGDRMALFDTLRLWFEEQITILSELTIGDEQSHDCADGDDDDHTYFEATRKADSPSDEEAVARLLASLCTGQHTQSSPGERVIYALASIKKAPIKRAIVATHLARVAAAIRARNRKGLPIRVQIPTIEQGKPRSFQWSSGRFIETALPSSSRLCLRLMAPSRQLVAKLHRFLPVGQQIAAFMGDTHLMTGTVTESNRLSMVARFDFKGASVLITGDTGFSDFSPTPRQPTTPALLNLIRDLDVIQVAHHGGHAHWFYRVLKEAITSKQHKVIFLLLHGPSDRVRPLPAFRQFLSTYRFQDDDLRATVLFTGRPLSKNVESIESFVHPMVSESRKEPAREHDIRLICSGKMWTVVEHGISIATARRRNQSA